MVTPRQFKIIFAIWTPICLIAMIGIAYVVIHFVIKYW